MTSSAEVSDQDKKILVFGYETQMPELIRQRMSIYEASPFDGMVIGATIPRKVQGPDGRQMDRLDWLSWGEPLSDSDFEQAITELSARPPSTRFNELFMRVNSTPGVDWFDNEAFTRTVTDNWRRMGRLVREGELAGILFDPEHYGIFPKVFSIEFASQHGAYSIPECLDVAYRRGREVMRALNEEVVDLDVLTLLGHAWKDWIPFRTEVAARDYRMLPPFLDGLIDAKAEQTRLHDIGEGAYRYKSRWQFDRAHKLVHGHTAAAESLVPQTYLENILAGFGIWICDTREIWDPDNPYYTPQELEKALQYAFELTDQYVWIYHERIQPWALGDPSQVKFPEGVWRAIANAAAPYGGSQRTFDHRTKPQSSAPKAPRKEPTLVGHWPLSESPNNQIAGGPSLHGRDGMFETIADRTTAVMNFDDKWVFGLSVPTDQLPADLAGDSTISVLAAPAEAGTLNYTLLSGSLTNHGPIFELAMTGDGTRLRFEFTMFDPKTGEPVGWQKTGFYYDPRTPYRVSIRFEDGRFAGVHVNRHQAIFGLWDMTKHDLDIRPRQAARQQFYVGLSGWGPRMQTDRFKGKLGDLRIYDGALNRKELLDLSAKPDIR